MAQLIDCYGLFGYDNNFQKILVYDSPITNSLPKSQESTSSPYALTASFNSSPSYDKSHGYDSSPSYDDYSLFKPSYDDNTLFKPSYDNPLFNSTPSYDNPLFKSTPSYEKTSRYKSIPSLHKSQLQECKFRNKCEDKYCKFNHPSKWTPKWIPKHQIIKSCTYGAKCYDDKCQKIHPKQWSPLLAKKIRSGILCNEFPCKRKQCGFLHICTHNMFK